MEPIDTQKAYEEWRADPTPERLATTMRSLQPMINSEIQRYPGPKNVLRGKAKQLAVGAIRSYNPTSGAKLTSWVTTQLQPLNRYGRTVAGSVRIPEAARRQAAEVETRRLELVDKLGDEPTDQQLADATGLSEKRIAHLRTLAVPVLSEGALEEMAAGDSEDSGPSPGVELPEGDPALREATNMVYEELDARDRKIMEFKTGYNGAPVLDNMTIAKRLGVSPALVSQRSLDIANRIGAAHARAIQV